MPLPAREQQSWEAAASRHSLGAVEGMRILPPDRIMAINEWGKEKRFLKDPDT